MLLLPVKAAPQPTRGRLVLARRAGYHPLRAATNIP
jgi:hypothetical protein